MYELHVVLLGPVNDTIKVIKKHSNIDAFLKKYHFKGSGPGGDFNGPTIKSLINNDNKLNELKAEIGPENEDLILRLKNISEVHRVATRKELDIDDAKSVLTKFSEHWKILRENFDLSECLKIHIINDHMLDYFELTGKTLLTVSDEITEAAHSALRTFDERHGYKTVQKGTEGHARKQHKSTIHFNAKNLGDF